MTTRSAWLAIATIGLVALSLRFNIAMMADAYAGHDDRLFFNLGTEIGKGNWLGTYNRLTLAKGPMLPMVIAVAWTSHIPFKTLEFVIFLIAAGVTAWALLRVTGSRLLTVTVFIGLAFNPGFWNHLSLGREALYEAFSVAVVALLTLLVLDRANRSTAQLCALSFAGGLTFAAYWLTREESVWLYPTIAVLLAYGAFASFKENRDHWRQRLRRPLAGTVFAILGFVLGIGPVIWLNWVHYGVPITNEFRPGPFLSAYAALARIDSPSPSRYVPISENARQLAYVVSPSARELEPHLKGDVGRRWMRKKPKKCQSDCVKDIAGGWFIWALRESAAAAGHFNNAPEAASYFSRMAREINAACDAGSIPCLPQRISFAPRLHASDLAPMLASTRLAFWRIVSLQPQRIGPKPSSGDDRVLIRWRKVMGPITPPLASGRPGGLAIQFSRAYSEFASGFLPILWVMATFGLIFHILYRRPAANEIAVLLIACLIAVVSRAFIAAYIDVTSFTGGIARNVLPAYGFSIIFAIAGTFLLIRQSFAWVTDRGRSHCARDSGRA